jgi:3-dehydroquinate dehydratase
MKMSFLGHEKPLYTVMVQADTPERIEELVRLSIPEGADAFGMQICQLQPEYRNRDVYRRIFSCTEGKPIYATNYRIAKNEGKSDETLAQELLELAECGATICDMMGDYFDPTETPLREFTENPTAVKRQMELVDALHERGAEVIMSSHVCRFISAEDVLRIARAHEARGADVCKIVVGADTMEEQIENMRIATLLKKELKIPFLFLSGGECRLLRRIGGELGCCMYLCVHEYDDFATPMQPLLTSLKTLHENL